ncbi:MAG: hypothetical protein QW632_00535 [Ignisphaera sp.]
MAFEKETIFSELIEFIRTCFDEYAVSSLENNFHMALFSSLKGWTKVMLYPARFDNTLLKSLRSVNVVGTGMLAGWIWGGRFIPSPHLYNFIKGFAKKVGCGIVAKPQGVKAFLYGNDLLLASFEEGLPPILKGRPVAVIDRDDYTAIGIGIALHDLKEIESLLKKGKMLTPIVKNVFDLGVHIRNEEFFY